LIMTAPVQQNSLFPDLFPAASLPVPAAATLLNPEQQAAVDHRDSHLLVVAGAGTGKTRMLIHRLVSLLNDGVRPHEILMLTFSNSAASEMRSRASLLLKDADLIFAGTYHAVALRLLRRYGHLADLPAFEVLDRSESESLLTHLKNVLKLGDFPKARKVSSLFSSAANMSRELADLIAADSRFAPHLGGLYQLHEAYTGYKREHCLADYDDLLLHFDDLLFLPESRRAICAPFRHVLVDEFQDTNPLQLAVLQKLAAEGALVTAVGDDAQSIYAFRGADSSIMRNFPYHFSGCRVLTLATNYRSCQPILDVANAVMQDASGLHAKALQSVFQGGVRPSLRILPTERKEGGYVASRISSLLAAGTPPEQIAVIYSSSVHALPLEMHLNALRIPYIKRGGLKLADAAHVKDLLALLRLALSPDHHSRRRLLMLLPGVKEKTAEKILSGQVPAKVASAVDALDDCITVMQSCFSPGDACAAALGWYRPHLERLHADHARRRAELEQVCEQIASVSSLRKALDAFSLDGHAKEEDSKGKVTLSTVHWAKGREFPQVFVIGLAEGRFSSTKRGTAGYEEDRRKLYVALTRAKERLELTAPRSYLGPDFAPRTAGLSSLLVGVSSKVLPVSH
jgi:DNA helicase-2/ATP-dependent DNA helicase PcrA